MQGPLKEHKNVQDENPALKRLQQDKENKLQLSQRTICDMWVSKHSRRILKV